MQQIRSMRGLFVGLALLVGLAGVTGASAGDKPATVPLDSLHELSAWTKSTAPWNRADESLRQRRLPGYPLADVWVTDAARGTQGRVIAMHDMAGGYAVDQDRFPSGTGNTRLYRFTYWQFIDSFIYFSHHRVSFPPPGWTDSAHRNGVLSLGTFNIEGDKEKEKAELRELLDDGKKRRAYAAKLAAIAEAYGFDGYLVNIEIDLPGGQEQRRRRTRSLRHFVEELRTAMRRVNDRSSVIWYDSIVRTGRLSYQDELNAKNRMFFDAADGITVNYNWSPPIRHGSPEHSAKVAGKRAKDVFSAVDVFCRESNRRYCAFDSYLGARPAFRAGTSFGVFGPAWTYEGDGSKQDHSNFVERDRHFWIGTAGEARPRGGVAEFVASRPIPSDLPFRTTFAQGFGTSTSKDGKVVGNAAWGNVGRIDVLPTWRDLEISGAGRFEADLVDGRAFEGGASFRVRAKGAVKGASPYSLRPLFRTAFAKAGELTYAVRTGGLEAAIVVVAADEKTPDQPILLVLAPPGRNAPPAGVRYRLGKTQPQVVAPAQAEAVNGWSRRTYRLDALLAGRTIAAIGILAYPKAGAKAGSEVRLGELSVR